MLKCRLATAAIAAIVTALTPIGSAAQLADTVTVVPNPAYAASGLREAHPFRPPESRILPWSCSPRTCLVTFQN